MSKLAIFSGNDVVSVWVKIARAGWQIQSKNQTNKSKLSKHILTLLYVKGCVKYLPYANAMANPVRIANSEFSNICIRNTAQKCSIPVNTPGYFNKEKKENFRTGHTSGKTFL